MDLNKIYCENCLDTMSRMPDGFIDLTVTSPPYDNLRTYNDNIDETWGEDVWKPIIKELYRVTKEGGVVVWVVGDATINGSETGTSFKQALWAVECGFNLETMIWEKPPQGANGSNWFYSQGFEFMFVFTKGKPNAINKIKDRVNSSFGRSYEKTRGGRNKKIGGSKTGIIYTLGKYGYRSNVWQQQTESTGNPHPAPYPEKLAADHIKTWSNENDIVYDPFTGSATTLKMAHLLKRKWIGSEISKEYVELAEKRLHPYLTQQTLAL